MTSHVLLAMSLYGKEFNIEHYVQTFQPDFFLPAMLIGTIDLYSFTPLSVALTPAEGEWGYQWKPDLLGSFSCMDLTSQDRLLYCTEAILAEQPGSTLE